MLMWWGVGFWTRIWSTVQVRYCRISGLWNFLTIQTLFWLEKQCLIFSFSFVLQNGEIINEYGDRGEESLEELFGVCSYNRQRMRCEKCKKDRWDIFNIARRYINYGGVIPSGRCEDWRWMLKNFININETGKLAGKCSI